MQKKRACLNSIHATKENIIDKADKTAVTAIFRRHVKNGRQQDYIKWSEEISEICKSFNGYQATKLIRPLKQEDEFVTIVTFDNYQCFQKWESSKKLALKLNELKKIINEESSEYISGFSHWLGRKETKKPQWPPSWRIVFVAYIAIWPLVYFLPPAYQSILPEKQLLSSLLSTAIITIFMGYGTMPLMEKIFGRWL